MYIAADGCSPSSASIAGSAPRARVTAVMSTKATPRCAQTSRAAAELERDGYRFRTGTDTEVILALYERGGLERMLERLNGMFAIVCGR